MGNRFAFTRCGTRRLPFSSESGRGRAESAPLLPDCEGSMGGGFGIGSEGGAVRAGCVRASKSDMNAVLEALPDAEASR